MKTLKGVYSVIKTYTDLKAPEEETDKQEAVNFCRLCSGTHAVRRAPRTGREERRDIEDTKEGMGLKLGVREPAARGK